MTDAKIWFITGTSSGFGRAMTEYLLKNGHKVVATLRKPEALSDLVARYPSTQLLVVKLDVTNKADVSAAFTKAQEVFGRIDVVYNNAGVAYMSELESSDEAKARDVFEVNFWGAAYVTHEAVRFFREVNKPAGGRLLQVSSQVGLVGGPAFGYYAASKHGKPSVELEREAHRAISLALEGLSESLALELDPAWNIKVTIVEPGPFRTEAVGTNLRVATQHPAYANPALMGSQIRVAFEAKAIIDGDVTKAAVVLDKLTQLEDAPIRFPLHRGVVMYMKEKAKSLSESADRFASWSDDLYHDK